MAPARKEENESNGQPRPTPSELLWAHQMKRENALLMDRMKSLESQLADFETAARNRNDGDKKITGLEERLDTFAEKKKKDDEKLRRESLQRFESLQGDVGAITMQVAALGKGEDKVKEVKKRLDDYELQLLELGRVVDEEKMEAIRDFLEDLKSKLEAGQKGERKTLERLGVLEEVAKALQEGSDDLREQLQKISKRPVRQTTVMADAGLLNEQSSSAAPEDQAPRKTAARKGAPKAAGKGAAKTATTAAPAPNVRTTRAAASTQAQTQAPPLNVTGQEKAGRKQAARAQNESSIAVPASSKIEHLTSDQTSSSEFVAPNGRRGRNPPRKANVDHMVGEAVLANRGPRLGEAVQTKRGPGRPRKDKSQAPAPSSETIQSESKQPKGAAARGTKRKALAETQGQTNRATRSQAAKAPAVVSGRDVDRVSESPPPQKKGKKAAPVAKKKAKPAIIVDSHLEESDDARNDSLGASRLTPDAPQSPDIGSSAVRKLDFKGKGKEPVREEQVSTRRRIIQQSSDTEEEAAFQKRWLECTV